MRCGVAALAGAAVGLVAWVCCAFLLSSGVLWLLVRVGSGAGNGASVGSLFLGSVVGGPVAGYISGLLLKASCGPVGTKLQWLANPALWAFLIVSTLLLWSSSPDVLLPVVLPACLLIALTQVGVRSAAHAVSSLSLRAGEQRVAADEVQGGGAA